MSEAPEPTPDRVARRDSRRRQKRFRGLLQVLFAIAFVLGIYLSMKLGISMATTQRDETTESLSPVPDSPSVPVEGEDTGIYLAKEPNSLRAFFSEYPTPGERAQADLTGRSIRRIAGSVDLIPNRVDADVVQVRVASGPIAGALYWVHHSQMPAAESGVILSPVPQKSENEPKKIDF